MKLTLKRSQRNLQSSQLFPKPLLLFYMTFRFKFSSNLDISTTNASWTRKYSTKYQFNLKKGSKVVQWLIIIYINETDRRMIRWLWYIANVDDAVFPLSKNLLPSGSNSTCNSYRWRNRIVAWNFSMIRESCSRARLLRARWRRAIKFNSLVVIVFVPLYTLTMRTGASNGPIRRDATRYKILLSDGFREIPAETEIQSCIDLRILVARRKTLIVSSARRARGNITFAKFRVRQSLTASSIFVPQISSRVRMYHATNVTLRSISYITCSFYC